MECLQDLAAFHSERIDGYEAMLSALVPTDRHLATLFQAFIKQSVGMKDELVQIGSLWEIDRAQLEHGCKFGLAWSVVKTVFSSRMPSYVLDKCRSGENALLIAYHSVEGTDGLEPAVRQLVKRQKRELIAARDWILHFEGLRAEPSQLSAV